MRMFMRMRMRMCMCMFMRMCACYACVCYVCMCVGVPILLALLLSNELVLHGGAVEEEGASVSERILVSLLALALVCARLPLARGYRQTLCTITHSTQSMSGD